MLFFVLVAFCDCLKPIAGTSGNADVWLDSLHGLARRDSIALCGVSVDAAAA
jgi:hypothetical protein